ncbi:LuxR family transcriptional regulator [Mycobacterium sp. ACS4331]|uniref:helix-turn-helix transcriptional regulator n=1 Tax=Mycobacterium sp. ACS4331 TaxID=1834121 RepID=UPI0008021198|nr:LuxR family transcriptional regulator [Mycobacterium sp. ACS4331]OBF21701.1 helix-turn-helix transcriptional regulator [Mycobacterium sp. ACS4331]
MRLSWPLSGRSGEMRAIEAAIGAPDVSGVVVHGPAGVGRSRLARQVLETAHARGVEVRWVVGATSAAAVPLGAMTAWAPPGATDTVHLLRGVIESLTAAPPGVEVLIGVDDVHLLDDLSAFVLHQIAQRGRAKLLLTIVDGKPIPAAVSDITRVGQFDRLELKPLGLDETTALLSAALGGALDPDAALRLWRLTRGNVLYLRTIVEQEVADGGIVEHHGLWRWVQNRPMPSGLVEVVESQIGALPAPVSDVLDVLAVAEPLELSILAGIADATALEEAEGRELITLEDPGTGVQVRLAHPLYAEVRRGRAAATRLRRFRGLVATELAAGPNHDDIRVIVRRAMLSLDSDLAPDGQLLVGGSHGAIWLADLHLAERLAAAADSAGAGTEAKFLRAHALSWLGRGEDADAILIAIPCADLTGAEQGRLAFLRASNMLWALGDPGRAAQLIDEASRTAPLSARGYIDAFRTVYLFALDQPGQALDISKSLAVEDLPAVVGAEIAWVVTVMAADAGQISRAVDLATTGYAVTRRSLDAPQMRFNIADAHVSALLLAGRVGEAGILADRVCREAADLPGAAQSLGAAIKGRADLGAGRVDAASAALSRAAGELSAAGHATGWGYRYGIPRVTALAMCGATSAAASALAEIGELDRSFRKLGYEYSLARAWLSAAQGAVSEAVAILRSAAEESRSVGQHAAEVLCLQTAVQFGDSTCAPRLRELEQVVEGPRVGLAARFADGLRGSDADELSAVSDEFERIGDVVAAADAAARAALVHRLHDRRGSALGCSTRASRLAAECGGLSTPALRSAGAPLPLTDREREIVMLIGEGLSNRAIAARLIVSVRTVESHIYKAMAKTGTARREELAALVSRPRAGPH